MRVAEVLVLKFVKVRNVDRGEEKTVCVLDVARNANVNGSAEKELWESIYMKGPFAGRNEVEVWQFV